MFKIERPEQGNKKTKKKIIWLISILFIVTAGSATFWYNKSYLILYYLTLKYNHFKVNDKLYAKNRLINNTSTYGPYNISLYRKIKPVNSNSSGRPFMMRCAWSINSDSLCKYKTAYIGNYTGYEIYGMANTENKYHPMTFLSITTNKKALVKDYVDALPAGYEFDEGPLYVTLFEIGDKELHTFRAIKK